MHLLASGEQIAAERTVQNNIKAAVDAHVLPDVQEVFFLGVCTRSRFEIPQAAPLLKYVSTMAPTTVMGRAAAYVLKLDGGNGDVEATFRSLDELSGQNPNDPLVLWMVAVECRSLKKPAIGVKRYAKLCEQWNPGPVLVHQTYANLLDDLGKFRESLLHRELAVKLEPAGWSYDGLGNTLGYLKRFDEADEAHRHATEMEPNRPQYWRNWAHEKTRRGDTAAAAALEAKAAQLEHSERIAK